MIHTDLCIIGAGPVGLFAVFEAGLLKMRCHLIDALPQVGGQLSEIYPQKPIYDIPGYPEVNAQDLVDNLMEQAKPFSPTFTLGERVDHLDKQEDGSFIVTTSDKTKVHAQVVIIAGGLGCFEPRKPAIENLELYEGNGVTYMVKDPEKFRDKNVVLAGGGDSALDWTIFLSKVAKKVTLVHRNETFRGAPDSAAKVFDLANNGKIDLILSANLKQLSGNGKLDSVTFMDKSKVEHVIETDYLIPLFGLSPKLGPIADWGLSIDKNAIEVDTRDYSTGVERIYAIGDINTYPGKLKLILCGFHEAAIMMHSAFKYVYPDQKLSFKYTTVNGVNSF
ncbi:NAD(P)/FAD-dependent oxidoreductase [Algoriphagus halophytocola]|uniref:Ferredoxin--NADP reductase n=1 Tax=Algoriphagus halophytocola TaxID=2991499 RepID=A0ABY6MMW9_9BACT|nr:MULTISPECIES: NAD(P)/FAD-dependent oxidoreductase [unclassified Algoriphagus]UZD24505.1 NAD(P)/FAD-dependent oxidoreductase [Algoriphagus sp. TR-M5]WBL41869.1 NAD(P)/FAD-dependent oxidoreductase [Algoriphagus sp. TR-M9]